MLPRTLVALAAASLTASLLSGCSSPGSDGTTVVASFYPLEYVAQRIVGEHADVVGLTSPGQEPHDAELSVQKTAAVADADLVLYEAALQPAVADAVDTVASGAVVEALDAVDAGPQAIPGARPARLLGDDPHFWLDPRALAIVARATEAELAAIDPDHAADYREDTTDLVTDLIALDGEISAALDDCARRTVVVSHEAFGYFGYRYDLDIAAIAGLSPDAEPSPSRLADLQRLIEDEDVSTVFYEELVSPDLAETLASDVGVDAAVLDPVEGLTERTADEDYLSLMQANSAALRTALDCR